MQALLNVNFEQGEKSAFLIRVLCGDHGLLFLSVTLSAEEEHKELGETVHAVVTKIIFT